MAASYKCVVALRTVRCLVRGSAWHSSCRQWGRIHKLIESNSEASSICWDGDVLRKHHTVEQLRLWRNRKTCTPGAPSSPLPHQTAMGSDHVAVSPWRWGVLAVFCSAAFMQGLVWAMPGPISGVLSELFNCDNACDALLVNWGPIAFLVAVLPSAWLIDHSLRWATISLAILISAGGWVRVASSFVSDSSTIVVLLHIAQAVNAIGEHSHATGLLFRG